MGKNILIEFEKFLIDIKKISKINLSTKKLNIYIYIMDIKINSLDSIVPNMS